MTILLTTFVSLLVSQTAVAPKVSDPLPGEVGKPTAQFDDHLITNARRLLVLVNAERKRKSQPSLVLNWDLSVGSMWQAKDMSEKGYFSHTDSLKRSPAQRVEFFGIKDWQTVAQNIAGGAVDADEVFDMWMKSPNHYANMIRPDITEMGVGYAFNPKSKYLKYWVQDFISHMPQKKMLCASKAQSRGPV